MFNILKHKLNYYKCNPSNVVRHVNQINDEILSPLDTNDEGVYGLEMLLQKDCCESYIIAPSHYENINGIETVCDYDMLKNSFNHLHCYTIEFQQPSFLPIGVDDFPLWEYFSQLTNSKVDMFMQLLLYNSQKDWLDTFIDQYAHYIVGNDYPVANKLGRTIQTKVLKGFNKIGQFEMGHKRNPHIEYKIKDHGYRFSWRLILHAKEEKYISVMKNEIQEILSTLDFFNQLKLYKVDDKETFLEQYTNRVMNIRTNQILSETELMGMFMGDVEMDSTVSESMNNKENLTQQSRGIVNHSGLELLPRNTETNKEIDETIGERIVEAIKELKLTRGKQIRLIEQTRSATLQKVTMDIPKGVKFSDIEKSYKDIKAILGYETFTIEPGHIGGTITFNIPSEDREVIYLRNLLESEQFKKAKKDYILPIIIGLDTLGEPLIIDLAELPHLLLGAATGGGKTYLLNCIILTLLLTLKPNELQLYLIDPKQVEFRIFEGFPNTNVETDIEKSIELLESICNEMDRRYKLMSDAGVRDIKGYNKKFTNKKLPYIVTVVDELADLMMLSDKKVEGYIIRLGQLARASGIHIILATQRPDKDVVTGIIKSNIVSRIALKTGDVTNSRIILDTGGAEKLLGKGDGLAKILGQKRELIRFQSPVITLDDAELEDILDGLKSGMKWERNSENVDVIEENEEEPIEKLKKIIARTGECRVQELQELMGIGMNKVHGMIKQLTEEGFLSKEGRSYTITADEDELELYRMDE